MYNPGIIKFDFGFFGFSSIDKISPLEESSMTPYLEGLSASIAKINGLFSKTDSLKISPKPLP